MTGPFVDHSIVLEIETGQPEPFIQLDPDGRPGDRWLHRLEEFDRTLDLDAVCDRYALPDSEAYEVRLVTVPAGVAMNLGDLGPAHGGAGGGEVAELLEYESVPADWIVETTTLTAFLE